MPNLLPQDNYDTYLTAPASDTDTTLYVNALPTKTSGYLTIYLPDGRTIREKIKYTGTSSSPNRLTGVTRGLPFVDTAGVVSDSGDSSRAYDHASNVRIAMTDNIHYLARALSQLNGDEATGGVMQNPSSRTIDSARDLVDKEYADALTVATLTAFAVTQNGADPSLTINVGAGRFIKADKTSVQFAGASAQAVTAGTTNYVELNPATNTLSINTSAFTAGSFPLAEVVASGSDITSITDRRPWLTMHDGTIDAVRTWSTIQTFTQDTLQITGDADSANDPVRKSYLDSRLTTLSATINQGGVSGTSGEAIAVGDALYIKTSDSKLYKCDADLSDEAVFKFVGIALTAVAGADLTVTFAPPGHVVTFGSAVLTANVAYYITNTAGTIGTTPGTRRARIGRALTTTTLLVMQPRFKATGTFTGNRDSANATITTGFRPAAIFFYGYDAGGGIVIGDDSGNGVGLQGGTGTANGGLSLPTQAPGTITIGVVAYTETGFEVDFGGNDASTSEFYYIAFSD